MLSVVMVCLGKKGIIQDEAAQNGTELHGLLTTLLSEKLSLEEKNDILNNRYGIAATLEMKEDMRKMCNLSDLIEERGIERGIDQGIELTKKVFKANTEGKSNNEIAKECGIPISKVKEILDLLTLI